MLYMLKETRSTVVMCHRFAPIAVACFMLGQAWKGSAVIGPISRQSIEIDREPGSGPSFVHDLSLVRLDQQQVALYSLD